MVFCLLNCWLSDHLINVSYGRYLGHRLDHLFDVPDEGSDTDLFISLVEFADGEEELVDLVVGDDGEDGVVEFGPGVGATVWIADLMAAALDVFPLGEAPDAEGVEHVLDAFIVGLVVDY